MSPVWRSWIRSAARAGTLAAGESIGTPAVVHATPTARTMAANRRRTATDASGTASLAPLGDRLVRPVLQLVETVVDAALREEIVVRPHLHDAALVEHDDAIDVLDRRQTVGDDDRGPADHQLRERVLDEVLGLRVDGARGFVE